MNDGETTAERLAQTFELFEFGVAMMAAGLRRRHPEASAEVIERMIDEWLADRPCDAPGVPVPLSRFR